MAKIRLGNKVRVRIGNSFADGITAIVIGIMKTLRQPTQYKIEWLDTRNIVNHVFLVKSELELIEDGDI